MDLTSLTARLNTFAGFDLTGQEACDLLNEAQANAARRSRYPRKTVELGPTVSGQSAYTLPADFLLPYSVAVAGEAWTAASRETVRQYEKESLVLQVNGIFYEGTDDEGTRTLNLYPAPSSGSTLTLEYVYSPTPLNVDEPTKEPVAFPSYWHHKLVHFVAERYYETSEDNPELAEIEKAKADAAVGDLERYDNERQNPSGIVSIPIQGVTA